MSKGRRRKAWAAQAARKRNPSAWYSFPAVSPRLKSKTAERSKQGGRECDGGKF
jgi:hypothetical protein